MKTRNRAKERGFACAGCTKEPDNRFIELGSRFELKAIEAQAQIKVQEGAHEEGLPGQER